MDKADVVRRIEELRKEAHDIKRKTLLVSAKEIAIKTYLSGVSGANGNVYNILYHPISAGSVTAQGRYTIQSMEKTNDYYWKNKWHLDTDMHTALNIKNVRPYHPMRRPLYMPLPTLFSYHWHP
jgi:hypothetical protein